MFAAVKKPIQRSNNIFRNVLPIKILRMSYTSTGLQYPLPRILSIQSHTVHGYVGNKAATFPLQCYGFHVDTINTITLSNRPDYGKGFKGKTLENDLCKDLLDGLHLNDLMNYDIVLSGYTRTAELLNHITTAVKTAKDVNPTCMYVCDPVLGDHGKFYVPQELTDYYRHHLIPLADLVTPNQFEAETLSGIPIKTNEDALKVAQYFHSLGVKTCVLKGLHFEDHTFGMIISHSPNTDSSSADTSIQSQSSAPSTTTAVKQLTHHAYRIDIHKISSRSFAGCGDLLTASVTHQLYHHLHSIRKHKPPIFDSKSTSTTTTASLHLGDVLEGASSVMNQVLHFTEQQKSAELCIIESADIFINSRNYIRHLLSTATTSNSATSSLSSASLSNNPSTLKQKDSYKIKGGVCGVIFDMDGTLTEAGAINFSAMYTRLELTRDPVYGDILSQIRDLPDPADRARARRVVYEEEMYGCDRMKLRPGLTELMSVLLEERIRIAISTRSCEDGIKQFLLKSQLPADIFTHRYHRDSLPDYDHPESHTFTDKHESDWIYINKPDPRVANAIMKEWQLHKPIDVVRIEEESSTTVSDVVQSKQEDDAIVLFVGDSIDDMKCGRLAGCKTCLIRTHENDVIYQRHPEYIDYTIHNLHDLVELVHTLNNTPTTLVR